MTPTTETARSIQGRATPLSERGIRAFMFGCAAVSILTTAGIILVLAFETFEFFSEVGVGAFLFDTEWTPLFADKHFGIWPLIAGTMLTTGIAASVAIPFGLLAAIYLSEFATFRARATLKPMLEVLAGVPTIVYGYFALVFVTPALQAVIPGLAGFNALSPGLVMGIMIIPMVSSLSEDALHAVSDTLREGAYALGARRLPTIFRVVLPAAMSGIAASLVLAISRAIGETAPLIVVGALAYVTFLPESPMSPFTALPIQIFNWVSRPQEAFLINAAAGIVVLLVTLLTLNSLAVGIRNRFQRRLR